MQKGPHAHDDHLPAWLHVHGQEPDTLVHLYGCGELLRRVRRRSRAASAFGLPRGVPLCRCCRISYLRRSALADVDLVSPRLERNHQSHHRRLDLRRPHCGNFWLALASVALTTKDTKDCRNLVFLSVLCSLRALTLPKANSQKP